MPHINTALENESSINDLKDVDTSSNPPNINYVLKWDGNNWIPSHLGGTLNLADLSDVTVTNPQYNHILKWKGGQGWINEGIDIPHYTYDLYDVSGNQPNNGDVLVWNDTSNEYEPQQPSGGGGGGSWVSKWSGNDTIVTNNWGAGMYMFRVDDPNDPGGDPLFFFLALADDTYNKVKGPTSSFNQDEGLPDAGQIIQRFANYSYGDFTVIETYFKVDFGVNEVELTDAYYQYQGTDMDILEVYRFE